MTFEQLSKRLDALDVRERELLTRAHFESAFRVANGPEDQKLMATDLAEARGCAVQFIGEDDVFAVFTKHGQQRVS